MTRRFLPALSALALMTCGFGASSAFAEAPAWTCGGWEKQPSGASCIEKRTCTRSICDGGGKKLENCRIETRTECVKPDTPPKPGLGAGNSSTFNSEFRKTMKNRLGQ